MLNVKILIVDKNKKFLKSVKKNLQEIIGDFQIETCTSAKQALEILTEEKYHAIISEIFLSDMNGLKFLSRLREREDSIPFIFFTSEGSENKAIEALNLGADYYIQKSGDPKNQFIALAREIEKQIEKRAKEELLQLSNEKYQSIFLEAKIGIVLINAKTGQITEGNKAFEEQTGRSIEELKELKIWAIHPPEKRELAQKKFAESSKKHREGSFELDILKPNGEIIQISVNNNFVKIDNIEYIQSITTDITELKKSEKESKKERNMIQKYLDIVGAMLVVVDVNENVILINQKSCEILGYKENEILGKNWFDDFLPERIREVTRRAFQQILDEDITVENYENLVLTKKGEEKLISWYNSVLKDDQGNVIASISSGLDITFRRKIHSELFESEKRFRTLFEDIPIGVGISNKDGRAIRANKKMHDITGYQEGLFEVNLANTFWNPDDLKMLLEILKKNGFAVNFETKLLHKDGIVYDALLNINVFQEMGEDYLLTFCQDITKLKQLEEEQIPLITTIEQCADSILITDATGEIIFVNPGFEKLTGYSYFDTIDQTPVLMRYIDEEFNDDFYANIAKTTSNGMVWKGRLKIKRKDGAIRIVERVITPVKDKSGNVVRFIGITRDVTDRMTMEKSLRESQKLYEEMFEQAPLPYQSLNKEGFFLAANEFWLKKLGYSMDEVLGKWFGDFLVPDFVGKFKEIFPKFIELGEIHNVEFDMIKKNGEILSAFFDGKVLYNDEGEMERTQCVFREMKPTEESESKLKALHEKQTLLYESANLGTWDWNIKTGDFIINKPFAEMLGYAINEIEPNIGSWRKILHKDGPCTSDRILAFRSERMELINTEHREISKSGEIKWIQCIGKVVEQDKLGNPLRAIGVHLDITEKKTAQLKVFESEIRYRQAFELIDEAFFITNIDGNIIGWNLKAETLFGYSKDQFQKLNAVDLYANPEDRIKLERAVKTQDFLKDIQLKMKKKDGKIFDVLVNRSLRRDQNGKIIGYIGSIRDISEYNELKENILKIQEQFDEQTSKLTQDLQEKLEAIHQTSSLLETEPSARIKEHVNAISSIIKEYCKSTNQKID